MSAFHAPSVGRTQGKGATVALHCYYTSGDQYSASSRTKRRGKSTWSPETGVFSQQSTFTIKTPLPASSKTHIQRVHDSSKIVTLFRGPHNNSGQRGASIKHIEQPQSNRTCLLMGNRNLSLDIMYKKRKAIKSQVLPDFIAEWLELQNTGPPDLSSIWTMYFDGSKRVVGAGVGVVLILPQGDKLKYVLRISFPQASNNEAEYEALLHGM
jgi:hypothetical protein